MNEEMVQQMMAAAERLASATEALDRVLGKMDAQQEMLNAKVDRIVAAVEETIAQTAEQRQTDTGGAELRERMAGLEKSNAELKALAARMARKTLSPVVSAMLRLPASTVSTACTVHQVVSSKPATISASLLGKPACCLLVWAPVNGF